ncbi:MAG: hypothetical protein HKM93_09815 [Desulfobacteraceae bacterium]|nr:hypothetical protein [Desulfobacteraceae bacterium]
MTILFTQYWDVKPGQFDAYSNFIVDSYNPAMERLRIQLLGGYYTAVGEGPRIIAVATMENDTGLMMALAHREFRIAHTGLLQWVDNYHSKVWAPTGRVTEGPYHIQTSAWKFNQYYDIVPGREEAHYRFVKEECLAGMKALGLPITGGWRLVVGSGPRILAEATGRNMVNIAKALDSAEFRQIVRVLKKQYAVNYSSRILAPTGRIEVPFLMKEMMKGF